MNEDHPLDGCALGFLIAGILWVLIFVAAAWVASRVLP